MTLTELAVKYSSDKLINHSYIPFYEQVFKKRNIQQLLEIGIGHQELMAPLVGNYVHGASLKMWAEYLPHAHIFACDIRADTLVNEGHIYSVVSDQYSTADLRMMAEHFITQVLYGAKFDVIIDDGCHTTLAQVITFMTLWPYLRRGGIYIIEDVGYPDVLQKAIDGEVHIFRKNGRWDDVLVTKEKQ